MSSKTKILAIFLVFALLWTNITSVSAVREDYDVFSQNNALNVCSCSYTKNLLKIRNKGDVTSVYTLEQSGDGLPWSTLSSKRFTLKAGEAEDVLDYVHVPCGIEGEYTLNTKIKTIFELEKGLSQKIDVRTCDNVQIDATALSKTSCPCIPVSYEFIVYNSGNHPETYDINVEPADEHVSLSASRLVIAPGDHATIVVFVTKPCDISGDFSYTLTVEGEGSGIIGEVPFDVAINQCYDYIIDAPDELVACNNFENLVPVVLRNLAHVANTYELTASLDEQRFDYEPVFLFPYQRQNLNLSMVLEDMDVAPYQLRVEASSARGQIVQQKDIKLNVEECDEFGNPILIEEIGEEPDLLPFLLAIAIMLLLLLILGWYFFKKSKHIAAAETKTRKELSEQEKQKRLYKWLIILVLLLILSGIILAALLLTGVIPLGTETNETFEEFEEDVSLEDEEVLEEDVDTDETEATPWYKQLWFLIGLPLLLFALLFLGYLWWRKRKATGHEKKKDDAPFLQTDRTKRWVLWLILLLLLLGALVSAGYFLSKAFTFGSDNKLIHVDTTGLETSWGAVVVKHGESVDIPVVAKNDDETDYMMDFTVDREWLDSDTKETTVEHGEEEIVFLTAHPDETISPERYAIEFPGEDADGNAFTDVVMIKVEDEKGSFWSRYLWFIVAAVGLLLLFIAGDLIRRYRRRRQMQSKEAASFITTPPRQRPVMSWEKPSRKKWWLILLLLLLLLVGIGGGVYYTVFAPKASNLTDTDLLEDQGLLTEGENFEESPPVEITESADETIPPENHIEVGNTKTIIPIRIINSNESVTYRIAVQEDVAWISVTEQVIEVPPQETKTVFMVVDPKQGAKDGRYRIDINVGIDGQEAALFDSTIVLDVKKYRWLDTLLSYLFYIVLGLTLLFLVILLLRHRDQKKGQSSFGLSRVKVEDKLSDEGKKKGKDKAKTQLHLK